MTDPDDILISISYREPRPVPKPSHDAPERHGAFAVLIERIPYVLHKPPSPALRDRVRGERLGEDMLP